MLEESKKALETKQRYYEGSLTLNDEKQFAENVRKSVRGTDDPTGKQAVRFFVFSMGMPLTFPIRSAEAWTSPIMALYWLWLLIFPRLLQ